MKKISLSFIAVLLLLSGSLQALTLAELSAALSNSDTRAEADKVRDAGRKPAEVVNFLGIEEGMTVIDLVAATGYYTEVLSHAVGASGKVYMQNSPASLTGDRGTRTAAAIDARLANNRLANVESLNRDFADLGLSPNSIDAAIIALEIHELTRSSDPDAAGNFLAYIRTVLKPGGILGVVDHAGNPGSDNGAIHRADEEQIVGLAEAVGFSVVGTSDLLRMPEDDRTTAVFGPDIRGKTDRFLLKLQK
ncbi:MAG: methyltransferase domain-containing protein [Gammaproteobacteria bacterium]|nr:methyltransferase domain-containing protein [Gammaproteobacteria bacterium]